MRRARAPIFDQRDRVAVVTGASSGLGRRFAVDLAASGAQVVGLARRGDLLAELQTEMRARSPRSRTQVCDVSDIVEFRSVLADIEATDGHIDILINNAGIGEPDPSSAGADPLDPYRAVFETNFFAAVTGTLAVLPGMQARGRGVIVNVSSDIARAPGPGEPAYGASKAALSAFTEAVSFDVDGSGVHLHLLYPGWVPTAMGQPAGSDADLPPKAVRRTEAQVSKLLLERIGGPNVDIDAAPIARLAPVSRALFPRLYRRGVRRATQS